MRKHLKANSNGQVKDLTIALGLTLISTIICLVDNTSLPLGKVGTAQGELPEPKTELDISSIASYDHSSKMIFFGKNPRLRPIGGAGDLTNTLTNMRISAGGHSGQ